MNTETAVHTGRRDLGPFPPAAPSNPRAPHVSRARIEVDASTVEGPLDRVWESIGYDEFNWTYTSTGKGLLRTFADFSGGEMGALGSHIRPRPTIRSGAGRLGATEPARTWAICDASRSLQDRV